MATSFDKQPRNQPKTFYQDAHDDLIAALSILIDRLTDTAENSADDAVATKAGADARKLISKRGLIQAESNQLDKTLRIRSIQSGPPPEVIEETKKLAGELAQLVEKKNFAALAVRSITKYLGGAIAVFNGSVAAVPQPPATPAPAQAPPPASPAKKNR